MGKWARSTHTLQKRVQKTNFDWIKKNNNNNLIHKGRNFA